MHAPRPHLAKKHVGKREPALINLPLPLPTIPVLSPLLTPIIDGKQNQVTTTRTTNNPTVKPTKPTSQPPESTPTSTPGDGGNGGGGNGDGGNGDGGNDDGGNDDGGNSEGGGNTGGSNSNSPADPTNNNSSNDGPSHTRGINAGANPTETEDDFFAAPSGTTNSGKSTRVTTIFSGTVPIGTQTVGGGSDGGLTSDPQGDNPGGDGETTAGAGGSKSPKVSGGVIAAVSVVGALIFIVLFIIIRRKRYIARRAERRSLWWKEAKRESVWSGPSSLEATAGTRSARSSFATTFDHASGAAFSASRPETPPVPVMAELRDAHTTGLLLHSQPQSPIQVPPTPAALISFDTAVEVNDRRNSTFSTRSGDSDNQSQYLTANDHHIGIPNTEPSPMSVRPFSPSESFAFPKPPPSAATSPVLNEPTRDPFSDPTKVTESWTPLFFGTEVIRRPFAPTLHDEIAVETGEVVRVSKVFDDGWALVEKYPMQADNEKGKKKAVLGLIPVDCLREADQALSTFLTTTRLSSYSAIPDANMGTAV